MPEYHTITQRSHIDCLYAHTYAHTSLTHRSHIVHTSTAYCAPHSNIFCIFERKPAKNLIPGIPPNDSLIPEPSRTSHTNTDPYLLHFGAPPRAKKKQLHNNLLYYLFFLQFTYRIYRRAVPHSYCFFRLRIIQSILI